MGKDFEKWNEKKSAIDRLGSVPLFHEREIWFAYLGANVGFEQNGKGPDFLRPVIVFKKFSNEIFWAIPLTRSRKILNKNNDRYYFGFYFVPGIESRAILSQVRLIDARRLAYRIGSLGQAEYIAIKEKFKALIP